MSRYNDKFDPYDEIDGMRDPTDPRSLECPDERLELRLVEVTPTPVAFTTGQDHLLAALALSEYEIGGPDTKRKGPGKKRELPVVWCPGRGEELDPETIELLLKLTPVGSC